MTRHVGQIGGSRVLELASAMGDPQIGQGASIESSSGRRSRSLESEDGIRIDSMLSVGNVRPDDDTPVESYLVLRRGSKTLPPGLRKRTPQIQVPAGPARRHRPPWPPDLLPWNDKATDETAVMPPGNPCIRSLSATSRPPGPAKYPSFASLVKHFCPGSGRCFRVEWCLTRSQPHAARRIRSTAAIRKSCGVRIRGFPRMHRTSEWASSGISKRDGSGSVR